MRFGGGGGDGGGEEGEREREGKGRGRGRGEGRGGSTLISSDLSSNILKYNGNNYRRGFFETCPSAYHNRASKHISTGPACLCI